jgi:polar amino acid transport system substrate-binding protein
VNFTTVLRLLAAAIIFAVVTNGGFAHAQGSSVAVPAEVRVGVTLIPPYVTEQNGSLTGFNIELWNAIADRLKLKTIYQIEPDGHALEKAMLSKRDELTVAPVVITLERDEAFDFSLSILETGLQVMVRGRPEGSRATNPLWELLSLLFSRTTALWLGIAVLLVLVPAHLVWLLERRYEKGILSTRKYFPGIFESVYWAASTLTTQAETMPRQWIARIIAILWMFTGVVFVAFYTAQLTTTLTVQQMGGAIQGPDDLPGKVVATLAMSTAADYLREHHAKVQEFATTDEMFEALIDKKADAVVFGAPVLLYYAAHEGKGQVKLVGPQFNSAPLAIMFQVDSPLRRKVDEALLALRENGTYQQLYNKWFGGA